jgi:hypothetical protein
VLPDADLFNHLVHEARAEPALPLPQPEHAAGIGMAA